MQPFSGNQRPDLLTALMNMSLVLRLPRKMHLCRSSSNVPRLPSSLYTKPSRFAHFWHGAQSPVPARRNDIWTSKSGPSMWCVLHFDLDMCFAPQGRALFRHLNFQKCSEHGVPCKFWLRNVLRATTACTLRHLNFQKWSAVGVLFAFWLGNVLRATHLTTWLFDPPEPQIIGKTAYRDFPTFSRTWIFFLLTRSVFDLLSSSLLFSDSSHLCFSSVHIVGSLTSKLPSINSSC